MNNLQALRMDVSIGEVKMPIAALGVVNTFVVLALIPLVDKVVYPLLERRGIRPTQLQRIGKILESYQIWHIIFYRKFS